MNPIEILAVIFSIIYVILAARQNILCWLFGIIGVVLSFVVYVDVKLYSDATLQVFYLIMSIYGWWAWSAKREAEELSISVWPIQNHLLAVSGGILLALGLGSFWEWNGAALPYIDAFTTSFSIIATLMVTRKILENWIYWIIIDFVCIFVYYHREIFLFSALFLVYCIIAVFGFYNWRRQMSVNP